MDKRRSGSGIALLCAGGTLLAGCFGPYTGENDEVVSRRDYGPALQATPTGNDARLNADSTVIGNLLGRRSILPPGGPFAQVVENVMAANARSAEAELNAARLRAEAASKNWLPTIGPRVSLNSLGDVVSQIVIDQVLFDNGRKKNERAFAKADVEYAAANLSQATNDRAATALQLYIAAVQARELAALHRASLREMQHFQSVMQKRVQGGVSDPSDLHIIAQKVAELQSSILTQEEAEHTALAELNAMSVQPLNGLSGVDALALTVGTALPLSVTRAHAERARSVASARIDRADQFPTLAAQGAIGENDGGGLTLGGASFGLGTGARIRSIKAAEEAADRKVVQDTEDANRRMRALATEVTALNRQAAQARNLTARAQSNLNLFQRQYEAGQRTVMDVMNVYETFAARNASEVSAKYEALSKTVELARLQGVLVDGDQI